MITRRVAIKKLFLTLALGVILGFLLGRGIYHRPGINLSETELWDVLKHIETSVDYQTKLYQRLTGIESRIIKERLRE